MPSRAARATRGSSEQCCPDPICGRWSNETTVSDTVARLGITDAVDELRKNIKFYGW